MEKLLEKIAKQLVAVDEATLMNLWDKYHEVVKRFEPTKRWEEAVLIFNMIQAVRWKNQLFNAKWAAQSELRKSSQPNAPAPSQKEQESKKDFRKYEPKEKGKIIPFRHPEDDSS